MTAEQMNRAIAEWAGWHLDPRHAGLDLPLHLQCWIRGEEERFGNYLPNYASDLNAMHEAEEQLTPIDRQECASRLRELGKILGATGRWIADDDFLPIHATAAQRAEALLRTIGKWED